MFYRDIIPVKLCVEEVKGQTDDVREVCLYVVGTVVVIIVVLWPVGCFDGPVSPLFLVVVGEITATVGGRWGGREKECHPGSSSDTRRQGWQIE